MYKGILVDVDDTIFNFAYCSQKALEKTCSSCKLPYNDKVLALFHDIDVQLWIAQREGKLSVDEVLTLRAQQLMGELGAPKKSAMFQKCFQSNLSMETVLEPNAEKTLDYLSRRVRLYVASNGILEVQINRLKLAGILHLFSDVFVSDDIGYEKPNPHFFTECMKRSNLKQDDILMVGDSIEADMIGANNCNIDSCWYNPRGKMNTNGCKMNYIIQDLSQLNRIIVTC